jgi:hypothetical protein
MHVTKVQAPKLSLLVHTGCVAMRVVQVLASMGGGLTLEEVTSKVEELSRLH